MTKEFYSLFMDFMGYEKRYELVDRSGQYIGDHVLGVNYNKEDAEHDKSHYDERYGIDSVIEEYQIPFETSFDALTPVIKKIEESSANTTLTDLITLQELKRELNVAKIFVQCLKIIVELTKQKE